MSSRRTDVIILTVGVFAVSTAAVLIREADAPVMAIAAYRLGLASLPLLAIAGLRRRALLPVSTSLLALTLLSGVFLALHFGFWVASVKQTSIVTSVVLVTTSALFVAVAGGPLLGERPSGAVWWALAIAAAGTLLMVSDDFGAGGDTLQGDAFALLGALFAAGYILAGRRLLGGGYGWLQYVTLAYTTAALILLGSALIAGETLGGFSGRTYLVLVGLAVVPQLIGHTAVNRSLGRLPAVVVSIAILGEPVGATLLGFVLLNETPTVTQIAGALVVLTGVAVGIRGSVTARGVPAPAT